MVLWSILRHFNAKRDREVLLQNSILPQNTFLSGTKNPKYFPLYAFVLTAVVYAVGLSLSGVLGNGVFILETGDMKSQIIPFIMQMGEVIRGKHNLWYSWNVGLGISSIGSYAYYAFSPFNIFYWILGNNGIHIASALIVVLKAATSALTFQIFISKFLKRNFYETILFSLLYALNGFTICYYNAIINMDAVYIFPVIMLGIIMLVRENKISVLIFSYSYIIGTFIYMGYVTGVSSFIIFVFYFLYARKGMDKDKQLRIIGKYCFSVLASLGLTACIWIPALYNIIELKNNEASYIEVFRCNIITIVNNLFMGQYQSRDGFAPYCYCGLLTIIALPLFFLNKRIKLRKRIYTSIILVVFFVVMLVPTLNRVLHCFDEPNQYGYRYAFVISFILVTIMAIQYKYLIGFSGVSKIYTGIFLMLFSVNFILSKEYFSKSKIELKDSNTVWIYVINIIIILLICFGLGRYRSRKWDITTKRTVFTAIIVLEVITNVLIVQYEIDLKITAISDESIVSAQSHTAERLKEESKDDILLRTVYQDKYVRDVALQNDISSLAIFTSLINDRLINCLQGLGFDYTANCIHGSGWTPVTLALLGIDYVVDGENFILEGDNKLSLYGGDNNAYQLYIRNSKVLPIAYLVDEGILDYELKGSVFEAQNDLLSKMSGEKVECYKCVDMNIKSEKGCIDTSDDCVTIHNVNYPERETIVEYTVDNDNGNDIYVNLYNNREVYRDDTDSSAHIHTQYKADVYRTVPPHLYPSQIFKCGLLPDGQSGFQIIVPATTKEVDYIKGYFVEYIPEEFDKIFERLNAGAMEIEEFRDGYVEGSVDCDEDCVLFTSIPYEQGWEAYIDGAQTQVDSLVENAFVGLKLTDGHHDIVFKYTAPGMYLGRFITIVAAVLIMVYYVISRRKGMWC